MDCKQYYRPSSASLWGELEGDFASHVELLDLSDGATIKSRGARYGLVGFCCDASAGKCVGSLGAADAPEAIRAALQGLNLHSSDELTFYDVGDVVCLDGHADDAQHCLAQIVSILRKHQIKPLVLGGGTVTSFGHYQGLMEVNPCSHFGLVSFSSCLSLQSETESGGSRTSFWKIAQERRSAGLDFNYTCLGVQPSANGALEFEHAHEVGAHYLTADIFQQEPFEDLCALLDDVTKESEAIFLSVNLNVFASAFASGVVRPQPLGVSPTLVVPLIRHLLESGKVSGFEVLGLNPPNDTNGLTAKLAADLIYQLL